MSEEQQREKVICVVTGKDYAKDHRIGLTVIELGEDDKLGKEEFFLASAFKARVGYVYTYERLPGTTTYAPATVTYVEPWYDDAQREKWQLGARLFDIQHDKARQAKDEYAKDTIGEVLKPLSLIYQAATRANKRALLALIIETLEDGPIK